MLDKTGNGNDQGGQGNDNNGPPRKDDKKYDKKSNKKPNKKRAEKRMREEQSPTSSSSEHEPDKKRSCHPEPRQQILNYNYRFNYDASKQNKERSMRQGTPGCLGAENASTATNSNSQASPQQNSPPISLPSQVLGVSLAQNNGASDIAISNPQDLRQSQQDNSSQIPNIGRFQISSCEDEEDAPFQEVGVNDAELGAQHVKSNNQPPSNQNQDQNQIDSSSQIQPQPISSNSNQNLNQAQPILNLSSSQNQLQSSLLEGEQVVVYLNSFGAQMDMNLYDAQTQNLINDRFGLDSKIKHAYACQDNELANKLLLKQDIMSVEICDRVLTYCKSETEKRNNRLKRVLYQNRELESNHQDRAEQALNNREAIDERVEFDTQDLYLDVYGKLIQTRQEQTILSFGDHSAIVYIPLSEHDLQNRFRQAFTLAGGAYPFTSGALKRIREALTEDQLKELFLYLTSQQGQWFLKHVAQENPAALVPYSSFDHYALLNDVIPDASMNLARNTMNIQVISDFLKSLSTDTQNMIRLMKPDPKNPDPKDPDDKE